MSSLVSFGCATAPQSPATSGSSAHSPKNIGSDNHRWSKDTDEAWRTMTQLLPGEWRATTAENKVISVTYRLISNGSSLLETFTTSSGKETITVYHRDGGEMMLTHYCAQGNQATLRVTEQSGNKVVFSFANATNLKSDQDVMHMLVVTMQTDSFDQESTYRTNEGKLESTVLHFTRLRTDWTKK